MYLRSREENKRVCGQCKYNFRVLFQDYKGQEKR